MRRLACVALLGIGCTASNPAYDVDDGGSAEDTQGEAGTSSSPTDAGAEGEGTAADEATVTSDTPASSSSGGEPGCPEECGEHATCIDGGFESKCACDPGYEGDGQVCTPVATLEPLAWQLDCMGSSLTCMGEGVCVVDAPMEPHPVTRSASAVLMADPGTIYEVGLRVRAVVEPKVYVDGETNDHWNEGGTPAADPWNVAYLEVEDPPRLIYVNAGESLAGYCLGFDQGLVVRMRGGSQLEIGVMEPDNCAVVNVGEGGEPISLPDVEAPPQPHNGQFMLVEAVEIVPQ